MTVTDFFVVGLAAITVLIHVARTNAHRTTVLQSRIAAHGRGLLDEMATAIEDVAKQILSIDSRRNR